MALGCRRALSRGLGRALSHRFKQRDSRGHRTLSERTGPAVGIETRKSQRSRTSSCSPFPSPPSTSAIGARQVHVAVASVGALVETHQPVARLLQLFHGARQIGDPRNRQMRDRSGGSARALP